MHTIVLTIIFAFFCTLQGVAQGILPTAATVSISDQFKGQVGDIVYIPVILSRYAAVPPTSEEARTKVFGYEFTLHFNPSVLMYRPDLAPPTPPEHPRPMVSTLPVRTGIQTLEIRGLLRKAARPTENVLRTDDTLCILPMLICLGDAIRTPIEISKDRPPLSKVFWLDSNRVPIEPLSPLSAPRTAADNGALTVANLDPAYLINVNTGGLSMSITPNPAQSDFVTITLGVTGEPLTTLSDLIAQRQPRLEIYSATGQLEKDLTELLTLSIIARGTITIPLKKADLKKNGLYFCRFSLGPYTITRTIFFP